MLNYLYSTVFYMYSLADLLGNLSGTGILWSFDLHWTKVQSVEDYCSLHLWTDYVRQTIIGKGIILHVL